jgi:hypothetical protein
MPATDNNNGILLEPPAASNNILPDNNYETLLEQDDLNIVLTGVVSLVPSENHLYGAAAA